VYAALGNNDSDCDDYKLDPHSDFLAETGASVAATFPASERTRAQLTFAAGGYYSVSLPVPLERTKLLVLDDLFMSRKYTTCSGTADSTGADAQIDWLRQQLIEAREKKERIWVMGHIPPGVDPYSTALKLRNVCGGKAPEMFLSSDALPSLLAEFGDVIQLAIFAHTHMDEMRLLKPDTSGCRRIATWRRGQDGSFHLAHRWEYAVLHRGSDRFLDFTTCGFSGLRSFQRNWNQCCVERRIRL
jgi:sphingomyelin phosphodiesterase acid-like 3